MKREDVIHLVQTALRGCGASSDTIQHITEALTEAFDDEQAETLRKAEDLLHSVLGGLQ